MRSFTILLATILASIVSAAPIAELSPRKVVYVTKVIVTTITASPPGSSPPPEPQQQQNIPTETTPPPPPPAPQTTQAPQTQPPQSSEPGTCSNTWPTGQPDFSVPPESCGVSWLDTINQWRQAYNKPKLAWSPRLAQVAWNAGVANGGGSQKPFQHTDLGQAHSFGEVETPGYVIPPADANLHGNTPFSTACLNWLCEIRGDPLVKDGVSLCDSVVDKVNHVDVRGTQEHHKIFLGDYSTVGCAFVFNTKNPTGPFAGAYICDYGL